MADVKKKSAKKKSAPRKKKRRFIRLEVDFCFDFDYDDTESDVNHFRFPSQSTKDISSGGLSFLTDFKIPRHTLLRFKLWRKSWHPYDQGFIKPDWVTAGEPLYLVGRVLRSRALEGKFETAVRFINCNFRWFYYNTDEKGLSIL